LDHIVLTPPEQYAPSPPEPVQYAASNYLRQLFADMLIIKTKVFIGGLDSKVNPALYADALSNDFITAAKLNPQLIDTYFIGESAISWAGKEYAKQANTMLKVALEHRPDQWIIPFFMGFNHFFYLQDSASAISYINMAHQRHGPPWLHHFATLLAGQSGQLKTGHLWLQAMYRGEKDPSQKARYKQDMEDFEYALKVQHAVDVYHIQTGKYPDSLSQLTPHYFEKVKIKGAYHEIHYQKPSVQLFRIQKNKR